LFHRSEALREVAGTLGQHLKIIKKLMSADLRQSGEEIVVTGELEAVEQCVSVLKQLAALVDGGHGLHPPQVDQMCRLVVSEPETRLAELFKDTVFLGRKKRVYPRSIRQRDYCNAVRNNDLVFGIGPAGTGKTYLAMALALSALTQESVRKIILCRPAVEAGEKLGFLPGDLMEKVNPYLRPLYDALYDLMGPEKSERMIEREIVEVAPLAFMRGRTLSNAFVILDEAQNTTPEQMKMFLTRVGVGSKVVVTGDPSQVDLPGHFSSGLRHALQILQGVEGIAVARLTDADVVRHPLVAAIIRAYGRAEQRP
jgi:phosphate starvation-inducible protein PhoH and related proteins